MNANDPVSTQGRVSAATEATAASVRQIRPLSLPEEGTVPTGRRERRGRNSSRFSGLVERMREAWLIPLGAAAVVAALAVSLVIVRNVAAPGPGSGSGSGSGSSSAASPGPAVEAVPHYFAIATEGKRDHAGKATIDVAVRDVRTGRTVADAPMSSVYVTDREAPTGVSSAGDDRTFVIPRRDSWGDYTFFQMHITPGTHPAASIGSLPITIVNPGVLLGFAVSPNDEQLAVLTDRGNGTTLTIYSVLSGQTLRTWTTAAWKYQGHGTLQASVSWRADNRQVAFATSPSRLGGVLTERTVSPTAPSGDLATASKAVLTAPAACTSLLLTPDGGTVVCGTTVNYPPATPAAGSSGTSPGPGSAGCGASRPMVVTYSAATGKRLDVLYQYPGACRSAVYTVLWADASARHVIVESQVDVEGGQSLLGSTQYGVVGGGKFAPLPVPGFAQWSTAPAF